MGPVTPLLAVWRQMKKRQPDLQAVWVGTPTGPERKVVEDEGITFHPLTIAKLARYPSLSWLTWPMDYVRAENQARTILKSTKPSLIASVGGFSAVPIMRAARKKVPGVIHQLDAEPGLSNRATAQLCASVTTSFAYELAPFPGVKAERIATPSRFAATAVPSREDARRHFGLETDKPTIFVTGGGTGSVALNEAIWKLQSTLVKDTQVIHLTGIAKGSESSKTSGYIQKEFFDETDMLAACAAADVVVSRAGMGTIADLACLSKAAIFVPIPNSHQERNVAKLPCAVVQQGKDFSSRLLQRIRDVLRDAPLRGDLGQNLHVALPTDDGSALAERWLGLLDDSSSR